MDMRHKAFFVHEADAVHRQEMARVAQATAAGMSDTKGFKAFIDSLELSESRADMKKDKILTDKAMSLLQKWR